MDKETIAYRTRNLRDMDGLLDLINDVRQEKWKQEQEELKRRGKKLPPPVRLFTRDDLSVLCNSERSGMAYHTFGIRKKSGGMRIISAPTEMLKNLQEGINTMLQSLYEPSPAVFGFIPGRNVRDNAAYHTGRRFILNLDLKDFFPSITQARVWATLKSRTYGLHPRVAGMIAGSCCMKMEREDGTTVNVLPQGSPASPIITNMVCTTLDRRLIGLAKRFKCRYTRYADDITFSSDTYMFSEKGEFMTELRRIIAGQGFTINEKKTRLQTRGGRQEVTGLIASDRVSVPREYIRSLDNLLYIWEHYGLDDATLKMNRYPGRRVEYGSDLIKVVKGRIEWVGQVKGRDSTAYIRFMERFRKLTNPGDIPIDACGDAPVLLSLCTLEQFEQKVGKCVEFMKKSIARKDYASSFIGMYEKGNTCSLEAISIGKYVSRYVDKILRNNSMTIPDDIKRLLLVAHIKNGRGVFRVILGKRPTFKTHLPPMELRLADSDFLSLSDMGLDMMFL